MAGTLFGLGVGPGDPELITLKALKYLRAADVVAYFAATNKKGNAFATVESYLTSQQQLMRLTYPVTVERPEPPFDYEQVIADFYTESATNIAQLLDQGRQVVVICEGDPLLYGSFMYLSDRLSDRYETIIVAGVCSFMAASAVIGQPLVYRDQSLTILPATLDDETLLHKIDPHGATVFMKLGRNFARIVRLLDKLGLSERAHLVERATMPNQRSLPLLEVAPETVPYFAVVVVAGESWQQVLAQA